MGQLAFRPLLDRTRDVQMMQRWRAPTTLRQATRFALSGAAATALHVAVAATLVVLLLTAPPVANAIAFVVASVVSYLAQTLWSFSSHVGWGTLSRFLVVSLIGCLVAFMVAAGAQNLGLDYLVGIMLVGLTVPPLTFFLHKIWTYGSSCPEKRGRGPWA